MSKKKDKSLVLESPGVSVRESDKDIFTDEDFEYFKSGSSALTPLRGETINLLLVDDAGYFDNTNKKDVSQNKPSPERKRRLRLLK